MLWELDWQSVAEGMLWLGLALLALPGAILYKCESLADRAKERLDNQRTSFRKVQDNIISQEYQNLSRLLAKVVDKDPVESNEKDIAELIKPIRQFRKTINKYAKGLKDMGKWRTRSSIFLRGVLCSGICIILSAVLSGLAKSLSESELAVPLWVTGYPWVYLNHFLLILALASTILGIYFGVKTLLVAFARSE